MVSQKYFLHWEEEIKVKLDTKGRKAHLTIIQHSVTGKGSITVQTTDFEIFNLQDP